MRGRTNCLATGSGTRAKFSFDGNNNSLSVKGRIVCEIQYATAGYVSLYKDHEEMFLQLSPAFIHQQFVRNQVQTFQSWIEKAESMNGTLDRPSFKDSFFRTLNHAELVDPEAGRESFEAWLRCFSPITSQHTTLNSDSNPNPTVRDQVTTQAEGEPAQEPDYNAMFDRIHENREVEDLHWKIYHQCTKTRLFVTSGDLLGKGLKNIQEGDSVVLIAGVGMPMILRKDGNSYRSIGPAYIDGMMNGEMWPEDEQDLIDIVLI